MVPFKDHDSEQSAAPICFGNGRRWNINFMENARTWSQGSSCLVLWRKETAAQATITKYIRRFASTSPPQIHKFSIHPPSQPSNCIRGTPCPKTWCPASTLLKQLQQIPWMADDGCKCGPWRCAHQPAFKRAQHA